MPDLLAWDGFFVREETSTISAMVLDASDFFW